MARGQIVLNPSESKKLIAKGILEIDYVKQALQDGLVVIHPSSTTYFLYEEITGTIPKGVWVIGMISSKGACVEALTHSAFEKDGYNDISDPANFPFSWIFDRGKPVKNVKLSDVLENMRADDVYIKGVNSIDVYGHVGVLIASLGGGTIGKVLKAQKQKQFNIIYAAGLEKSILASIIEVSKEAGRPITSDALGIPCALLPIKSRAFTEIQSLKLLTKVDAFQLAAGGLGGAEGSTTMVVKGPNENVQNTMRLVKALKGTSLPKIGLPDCRTCNFPGCYLLNDQS